MKARVLVALVLMLASLLGPATPSPATIVPIDAATVNSVCLDPADDMAVAASAYDDAGYLLCVTMDENAEGIALYQETAPGSRQFNLVVGMGGMLYSADLQAYGVPAASADGLVSSVLQQLGS